LPIWIFCENFCEAQADIETQNALRQRDQRNAAALDARCFPRAGQERQNPSHEKAEDF
jgi:hypothetical protein